MLMLFELILDVICDNKAVLDRFAICYPILLQGLIESWFTNDELVSLLAARL